MAIGLGIVDQVASYSSPYRSFLTLTTRSPSSNVSPPKRVSLVRVYGTCPRAAAPESRGPRGPPPQAPSEPFLHKAAKSCSDSSWRSPEVAFDSRGTLVTRRTAPKPSFILQASKLPALQGLHAYGLPRTVLQGVLERSVHFLRVSVCKCLP